MIVRLAIKSGIVGGTIYYVKEAGVWEDSEKTAQLYGNIKKSLCPYWKQVRSQIPIETPRLPQTGEIGYLTKYYYNTGVKNSIYFIHRFPCYMGQWSKKGSDAIKKALNAPPAAEKKVEAVEGKK